MTEDANSTSISPPFPSGPAQSDQLYLPDGRVYEWTGERWEPVDEDES